jgi:hypothetical protein
MTAAEPMAVPRDVCLQLRSGRVYRLLAMGFTRGINQKLGSARGVRYCKRSQAILGMQDNTPIVFLCVHFPCAYQLQCSRTVFVPGSGSECQPHGTGRAASACHVAFLGRECPPRGTGVRGRDARAWKSSPTPPIAHFHALLLCCFSF